MSIWEEKKGRSPNQRNVERSKRSKLAYEGRLGQLKVQQEATWIGGERWMRSSRFGVQVVRV